MKVQGMKLGSVYNLDTTLHRQYPEIEREIFKNLYLNIGKEFFEVKYKDSLRPTYPISISSKLYNPNILEYRLDLYILTPDEFKYAKKVEREYLDLKERYDKLQKNYNELLYRMGK